MAIRRRIMCVNKTPRYDPHDRIHNVGGVDNGTRWKLTEDAAILGIETKAMTFYTQEAGKTAEVIVATHLGNKYLKTTADGLQPDNLLALAECP